MPLDKARLAHIVFESDDYSSKAFDIILLLLILGSVAVAMLDSVAAYNLQYGEFFYYLEWAFTILFTIEYALRIWLSRRARGYIFSFYGMIDLLAILPTYLSLVMLNTQYLTVIRALRLLRVIRILKLGRYVSEADYLMEALKSSRIKIQIFLFSVVTIVLIMGTVMFIVEGPDNGFTSIPMSMYWAIVTLTTVGFGDITPITIAGKFVASIIMLMGYAIIAVPTGIVSSELVAAKNQRSKKERVICPKCHAAKHDKDAFHCKYCGTALPGS